MRKLVPLTLAGLLTTMASTGAVPVDAVNFTETVYVTSNDIGSITGIAWAPDGSGRLFVIRKGGFSGQQNAQVRIVQNGAVLPEVFATESVYTNSECGLIGMTFDPNFINNRFVYFFLTVSPSEQQIIRYTDLGDAGQRAASRTVIVPGLPTVGANHDGGGIAIGNDGKLYWSIGDLGNGTGVDANLSSMAAKVGRADRFTGVAPNDNPFFDGPGGNADHIWARGFRNPFTMILQPATGQLWINTVGTSWEQVFVPQRGDHAGYNDFENNQPAGFLTPIIAYRTNGTEPRNITAGGAVRSNNVVTFTTTAAHPFRKGAMATIAGVGNASFNSTFPVASVPSSTQFTVAQSGPNESSGGGTATTQNIGGALTGGCFYDSTAYPAAYRGNFFFGDYNSGRIMRTPLGADNLPTRTDEFVNSIGSHVDMTTGPDGALYYANQSNPGTIRRLVYNGTSQEVIIYPTAFNVVEAGASVISVRLRSAPSSNVTVSLEQSGGDADLRVRVGTPPTLTFTPSNFATPQLFTIEAVEDADLENDSATFRIFAPGIGSYDLPVNGIDNDEPQLVVSTTSLNLNEGGTTTFTVRLANQPAANVSVSCARTSGDTDVSVSGGSSLTFTTGNYATPQTVTIAAAEDGDNASDSAVVTVSTVGEVDRNLSVTAADNDPLAPSFTSSPIITAVDDAAYSYDANAAGNPAPTFALTTAPSGMSIDAATGLINWTPTTPGTVNVTVQAANSVSTTTQSFMITVNPDATPTAVLTRPVAGEVLSGTNAEFFGDGLDDVSTVAAEFLVDGVLRYTDVNNGNHFHFGGAHTQFDTTQYTNGPHTFRLRVTDTRGQADDVEIQATIGNGGAAWQTQYFPDVNDPNRSLTADPNFDGEANLFEYFTGSNPTVPDVSRAPRSAVQNVSGTDYLTLTFVRAKWVNDVTARVEAIGDLTGPTWTQIDPADPTYLVGVQEDTPAFGLQTVTVRDVVPASTTPRFMRLNLTKP